MNRLGIAALLSLGPWLSGCQNLLPTGIPDGGSSGFGTHGCTYCATSGGQGSGGSSSGGGTTGGGGTDAGADAGADAGVDAGADAGIGGSDAGVTCPILGADGGANPCPPQAPISFILDGMVDIDTNAPIVGATVQAIVNSLPVANAVTDACGGFQFCLPLVDGGTTAEFSPYVTGGNAVPTYLLDFQLAQSEIFSGRATGQPEGVPIFDQSTYTTYATFLNHGDPLVIAGVVVESTSATCSKSDVAGWSLSLVQPDGGAVSGEMRYLDDNNAPENNPQATSTSLSGKAVFFNLDPTVPIVQLVAQKSGPGSCTPAAADFGVVGTVRVAPNSVSYVLYPIK
ncbi:MAG: hypothetical protein ACYCWW_10145 [Deltaproteobacteria bacterium]